MKWGVMGPGNIVRRINESFKVTDGPEIYAIASRSIEKAKAAAERYGAQKYYGSYEELAKDPDVDIVYVSTVNTQHPACAMMAMEAGKPVLCEKPIAMTAKEAKMMIDCAKANNVFFMEGMWTRYIPAVVQAKKWIDEGRIGKLRQITADFSYYTPYTPDNRAFIKSAGGSSLLEVGVYGITLSYFLTGQEATNVRAMANFKGDVDDSCTLLLGFGDETIAMVSSGYCGNSVQEAWLMGEAGQIHLPTPFWKATKAELVTNDGVKEVFEFVPKAEGFEFELLEVERCVREGLKESPTMPWSESIRIMELTDKIQTIW